MMEVYFQVKSQNYSFSYRVFALLLCMTLTVSMFFRPIKSKAFVPAIPGAVVLVAKSVGYYAATMGVLNLIDAAGGAFESIFGASVYEFWKENFTDEDSYRGFTSNLPPCLSSSSSGSTAKAYGFDMVTTGFDADFWADINLYQKAASAAENQFMLLGAVGGKESFYGLTVCRSPSGARYVVFAQVPSLAPYSAVDMPMGQFVSLSSDITILDYSETYMTWRRKCYLSVSDYLLDSRSGRLDPECQYMTGDTYISGITSSYTSTGMGSGVVRFANIYSVTNFGGTVGNLTNTSFGYITSGAYYKYSANPRYSDVSLDYPSTTRPTSIMDVISKWNKDNSIGTNPININYYISPTGQDVTSDNLSNPSLYDEESLVFTDPVTGNQYLTSGWTYDYLTRCYTLTMADTFTIDECVIDTIDLTYGDEHLTIDHYSDGFLVQSDSYDYVMVSGSECGLNGHSYTYETIKQETCTSTGERKYTCSVCGDEYAETVPAAEHPFTYTVVKSATCLSTGMGIYSCPNCGLQTTETIPKSGHSSVVVEIVPSEYDENGALISAGYTLYECTECGSQYTESEDVGVENESWFSWLGSLFKTLLSSIVNGLAAGLEWVIEEVLVTTVGWIIKAVEWVFGLFNGEHLTTLFNWFSFENEAWTNEFSDPTLFKEVA